MEIQKDLNIKQEASLSVSTDFDRLDWSQLKGQLSTFASSQIARDHLTNLTPLKDQKTAENSIEKLGKGLEFIQTGNRPRMESLDLYPSWALRLSKSGTFRPVELLDIQHFCIETLTLKESLLEVDADWAKEISLSIFDSARPLSAIEQLIAPGGEVRTDASEKLYQLTQEKKNQKIQIQNQLNRLVQDHEMDPILQDKYVTNREGRLVLPVKSGMQHEIGGIIHGASQTKQTVYMEPEQVVSLNNRIQEIDVLVEEEVARLLKEISEYLKSLEQDFSLSKQILLEWDILLAKAQFSQKIGAKKPQFSNEEFQLYELKHPLLALSAEECIANDVQFSSENRLLLLSGPNAGGKTVLLKSIGLAVQMARCGLLICTDQTSKLPFVEKLFISIGDDQSVDQHLSTFAAHLKKLCLCLEAKGPSNLILVDEICGSTDPEEGTALARAFLEKFSENRAYGVITSHLGPLKLGWGEKSGVVNGSLESERKTGEPTYRFIFGVPGHSMALNMAKTVGAPEALIQRARDLLSPETRKFLDGLSEIEKLREQLQVQLKRTQSDQKTLQAEIKKHEALKAELEKDRDKQIEEKVQEAEQELSSLIEKAKARDVFEKHNRLLDIKNELPKIKKASLSQSQNEEEPDFSDPNQFHERYPSGSRVFVQSIGREAIIQGKPNSKGLVTVLSESIRMTVPISQVQKTGRLENPTKKAMRKRGLFQVGSSPETSQLDLRGSRVEEAIEKLDQFLDSATLSDDRGRLLIVHGHGSESLKKAVRSHLARSPYVKSWSAATKEMGGDGATYLELSD